MVRNDHDDKTPDARKTAKKTLLTPVPFIMMWDPIEEFNSDSADALCKDLHEEICKLRGAHDKAITARTVKDMDEFNKLFMSIQSRVIRIMSIKSFFEDEFVRIGLGAVVTRAKQELSTG